MFLTRSQHVQRLAHSIYINFWKAWGFRVMPRTFSHHAMHPVEALRMQYREHHAGVHTNLSFKHHLPNFETPHAWPIWPRIMKNLIFETHLALANKRVYFENVVTTASHTRQIIFMGVDKKLHHLICDYFIRLCYTYTNRIKRKQHILRYNLLWKPTLRSCDNRYRLDIVYLFYTRQRRAPCSSCTEVALVTLVVAIATQRRHLPGSPNLVRQPVFSTTIITETPSVQSAVHAASAKYVRGHRAEYLQWRSLIHDARSRRR